jgi:hypothetical protein
MKLRKKMKIKYKKREENGKERKNKNKEMKGDQILFVLLFEMNFVFSLIFLL